MKSIHSEPYQRLLALLIKQRRQASITQQQLSVALGRPQSFVSKYERGERRLDVVEFLEVCRHLKADAYEIFAEVANPRVLRITAEAEIGKIYVGKVERIVDFGAFVQILPGKVGLVHISMISDARVEKVTDILKDGDEVEVLVLDVDKCGCIMLSIKDVASAKAYGV